MSLYLCLNAVIIYVFHRRLFIRIISPINLWTFKSVVMYGLREGRIWEGYTQLPNSSAPSRKGNKLYIHNCHNYVHTEKKLKLMILNVCGLQKKLDNVDFRNECSLHDIIIFSETKSDCVIDIKIKDVFYWFHFDQKEPFIHECQAKWWYCYSNP